jgi:hypothetical protein
MPSLTIALILASFFVFCIPEGTETYDKTQLAERKAFIEKAMEEAEVEREKAREETSTLLPQSQRGMCLAASLPEFHGRAPASPDLADLV